MGPAGGGSSRVGEGTSALECEAKRTLAGRLVDSRLTLAVCVRQGLRPTESLATLEPPSALDFREGGPRAAAAPTEITADGCAEREGGIHPPFACDARGAML